MYYFVTASKDASIYLQQPTQNTGRDEILEISKTYYGNLKDVSRSLIQFDITSLSNIISTGEVTASSADLIIKECESIEIPTDYTIYAHPVSQSWDSGIGTRFDIMALFSSEVRKADNDILDHYKSNILENLSDISNGSYEKLINFSALPDVVRGYEEVRLESMKTYYHKAEQIFKS